MYAHLQAEVIYNPWENAAEPEKTVLPTKQLELTLRRLCINVEQTHLELCQEGFAGTLDSFGIVLLDPTQSNGENVRQLAVLKTENCEPPLLEDAFEDACLHLRFGEPRPLLRAYQLDASAHQLSTSSSAAYANFFAGAAGLAKQPANFRLADCGARQGSKYLSAALAKQR